MPAEAIPLVKYEEGGLASDIFSYNSVIGMLFYVSGNMSTDVSYAANLFARYMLCRKLSHEMSLKTLVQYFNQANDYRLVLNPNYNGC